MSEKQSDLSHHSFFGGLRPRSSGHIVASVPLEYLVSDDFDFHKFAKAVREDKTLSRDEKIAYRSKFSPSAKVTLDINHATSSLSSHINSAMAGEWKPEKEDEPLDPNHPVSKMWEEVWQKTTVHHAGEAALYQERMAAKGLSFDDMNGYPAKTPPISLTHRIPGINAAAGPRQEGGVEAIVTKDFLSKVPPEEQRAILFHEAQHAFEPVLHGQEPFTAFILNKAKSMVTANSATRNWERRADEHAAKVGAGDELVSFFERMGKFGTERIASQHALLEHLVDNGFAFDPQKIANVLNHANQELHAMGVKDSEIGHLLPDADKRINVEKLSERVEKLNDALSAAASRDPHAEKPLSFRERIAKTIAEKTRSHPQDKDRIKALAKTEKCDGCDPAHPSKLHGDRVKQISKTGIQGWER
ncbi:MAG: hypothetical protein FJX23_07470 [Alphaproteobacteria bacterium]|nr:hypothetical protein [Alphaproteobacteria bacterium]